jgi:arylsulfatase A-like enzyme
MKETKLSIFRRFLLRGVLVACVFVSFSALGQSPQPNIVIILADDLSYGDVSCNGCPDYTSPNIDALGANGVWCSSGYVTHPFCSPSRAGLITGRYQQRFGHENQPQNQAELPLQELPLSQMLDSVGYVCGLVGKWHLSGAPNLRPTQRGFDEFFGFLEGSSPYFNASVLRNDTPLIAVRPISNCERNVRRSDTTTSLGGFC